MARRQEYLLRFWAGGGQNLFIRQFLLVTGGGEGRISVCELLCVTRDAWHVVSACVLRVAYVTRSCARGALRGRSGVSDGHVTRENQSETIFDA